MVFGGTSCQRHLERQEQKDSRTFVSDSYQRLMSTALYAVLGCTMLCLHTTQHHAAQAMPATRATLCYAMLAGLRPALRYAMLLPPCWLCWRFYAMLCYAMLCYASYATLCYTTLTMLSLLLRYATRRYSMSRYIILCYASDASCASSVMPNATSFPPILIGTTLPTRFSSTNQSRFHQSQTLIRHFFHQFQGHSATCQSNGTASHVTSSPENVQESNSASA